jgi:hypothetical protein
MTATLPARAAALRKRLVELDKMSSNVTEAHNLEGLRVEIASRAERLGAQLDKATVLAGDNISVAHPASLIAVRKRATGLLERFITDPKAATLKRGQVWTALLREVDAASRDLAAAVLSAWRAHRATVFAGDTPPALRGKLARTNANDEAFKTYEALYERLKAAFDDLPSSQGDLDKVGALAAQLEQIAQGFDFDVPAEVKRFLEAVLSITGAPLVLLTPEVRQWLEANGSLESYTIRSTGRG